MRPGSLVLALLLLLTTPLAGGDRPPPAVFSAPFFIQHSPAVSTQATISQAAGGAGVRNVVETVSFGFSATTALAGITTVTVNLRDGATGAGTILQSWSYTLAAAVQAPTTITVTGLHIQGTANTATTLEFSALVTNLVEFVNVTGYTSP